MQPHLGHLMLKSRAAPFPSSRLQWPHRISFVVSTVNALAFARAADKRICPARVDKAADRIIGLLPDEGRGKALFRLAGGGVPAPASVCIS